MRIPLTRGMFAEIDDADWDLVKPFKWHANRARSIHSERWYACACLGRPQAKQVGRRHLKMHRLLLGWPPQMVDHRDGNGLNNRRGNLRLATDTQNQANKSSQVTSRSRFKGVSWHKGDGSWQVRIRDRWIGHFDDEIEAAHAYDRAAVIEFGEFARLNFEENRHGILC